MKSPIRLGQYRERKRYWSNMKQRQRFSDFRSFHTLSTSEERGTTSKWHIIILKFTINVRSSVGLRFFCCHTLTITITQAFLMQAREYICCYAYET